MNSNPFLKNAILTTQVPQFSFLHSDLTDMELNVSFFDNWSDMISGRRSSYFYMKTQKRTPLLMPLDIKQIQNRKGLN